MKKFVKNTEDEYFEKIFLNFVDSQKFYIEMDEKIAQDGFFFLFFLEKTSVNEKKYSKKRYIYMFLQWFLVPIIAPTLGALPAIDSQTRILFKKYFGEFWVTEKIRK